MITSIAKYAMRSPILAIIVTIFLNSLPVFFWIGSAIIGLIILSNDFNNSIKVIICAFIPTFIWAYGNEFSPLLCLTFTSIMAYAWSTTKSLSKTIITSTICGIIIIFYFMLFYEPNIQLFTKHIISLIEYSFPDIKTKLSMNDNKNKEIFQLFIIGWLAWVMLLLCNLTFFLSRKMFFTLYKTSIPFGEEFKALTLSPNTTIPILILVIILGIINPIFIGIIPVLTLPLFFSGLSLIHNLASKKNNGFIILTFGYLLLLTLTHIVYLFLMLIAIIDSFVKFRKLKIIN